MRTRVEIEGMRTVHCVRAVFTALAAVEGITSAEVERGWAVIEHDGRATVEALRAAVAVAGYEVVAVRDEPRVLPVL